MLFLQKNEELTAWDEVRRKEDEVCAQAAAETLRENLGDETGETGLKQQSLRLVEGGEPEEAEHTGRARHTTCCVDRLQGLVLGSKHSFRFVKAQGGMTNPRGHEGQDGRCTNFEREQHPTFRSEHTTVWRAMCESLLHMPKGRVPLRYVPPNLHLTLEVNYTGSGQHGSLMEMLEEVAKERDKRKRNDCINARKRKTRRMKGSRVRSCAGRCLSSKWKREHSHGMCGLRTGTDTGSEAE